MEFWFSEFHTPDVKHSIRVNKQLYSKQSDYQRIDIFETPEFGRVLTLDGNVMLTERDEFIYDEMIVHVPMAVHKEAKDILVIGAGDGGVVRELTRYDRVERIDLVEMDTCCMAWGRRRRAVWTVRRRTIAAGFRSAWTEQNFIRSAVYKLTEQ